MINNSDGIIQFQECSNVISACHLLQSVRVRFQRRMEMLLFNFRNNCKHDIWDWLMMKIFQELISNQKVLQFRPASTTTCIML